MGGGASQQLQVQQIKKTNISKSPRLNNSKSIKNSPDKQKSPNQKEKSPRLKKKGSQPELFGIKTSESTVIEDKKNNQSGQLSEAKSRKKIKSVRRLPQALERENKDLKETIPQAEELNNSSIRYDRKQRNQKQNLQKLMRIYDLA